MSPVPDPADRYQALVALLREILDRVEDIERRLDELDRGYLRPYGDGSTPVTRRRS